MLKVSHLGKRNLLSVCILPELLLLDLVNLMLILEHMTDLLLLLCEFNLVLEHHLTISLLLNGPLSLFFSLECVELLFVHQLLSSLALDLMYLRRSESLEVVWLKAVRVGAIEGSSRVFSHEVRIVSVGNLKLVLAFLIILPCILPIALFFGQALVLFLNRLHHVLSLIGHLVLEHASHAVQC